VQKREATFQVAGGGLKWRVAGRKHLRVSGLSRQVSGTGYQVRVRVQVLNLYQALNT
jgi:hypothetical protein